MEFASFPAAVYRNGESKLVLSQEDTDTAEKDGWGEKPDHGLPKPERPDRPDHGLPGGDKPRPEHPIAEPEPPARPKKKD
jgi:hypothetical protein